MRESNLLLRPKFIAMLVAGLGVLLTVLFATGPSVRLAYRSASLHVALESAAAVIALVAAYLLAGRYARRAALDALLLAAGLGVLATSNLLFSAIPAAIGGHPTAFTAWAPPAATLLGAGLFVAAAFAPRRSVRNARRVGIAVGSVCILGLALAAAFVGALADRLGVPVDPTVGPSETTNVVLGAHPAALALQITAALLFSIAAVGFVRGAGRGEPLASWLASACVLAALARVNYTLFPSAYSEWVYSGDFFRLAFYVVLLGGAASEIAAYWRSERDLAVLEERRRVARELHDGLAQELAFILTRGNLLLSREHRIEVAEMVSAAERALDEARRAIAALVHRSEDPLDVALAETAEETAARYGARVTLDLDSSVNVPRETREALIRIVREAVSNAARHGAARRVAVALEANGEIVLRVHDDGTGFDPASLQRRGFGLTSMAERAHSVGGELRVRSAPGAGAEVEVIVPSP
jgi:signal transduction histidine kinase